MNRDAFRDLLIRHEGNQLKPYLDCCGKAWRECVCEKKGKLTIGVGRCLDTLGITAEESMYLLNNDINRAEGQCSSALPWFKTLNDVRAQVVVSMVFNIGLKGFLAFRRMGSALALSQYNTAADEMLKSTWAAQVKKRAVELAQMMRQG